MNLLLAEPHRAQPPAAARRNGAIFWANHGEACSNRSSSLALELAERRVRHVPVRALARRQGADRLNVTTCSSYQPARLVRASHGGRGKPRAQQRQLTALYRLLEGSVLFGYHPLTPAVILSIYLGVGGEGRKKRTRKSC